jgi:peptide/nickel transport system ATP-binding protein
VTPIPVIEGDALAKTFRLRGRTVHAVQDVSLAVHAGEALGIVGESGCGKTTTARLLLRLEEPSAGRIRFLGEDITDRHGTALLHYRSRAQLVFQNPFDALNPRFTIRRSLAEPLRNFGIPREEHAARIEAVMRRVRLLPADAWLDRRPHELSGGQLQRVVLARALLPGPRLIVADEPVSMLDVSVRAGILNLLRAARDELGLAAIYISHDLALIRYVCERTVVMYLGRIVEEGPTAALIATPQHPYTRALLAAVPVPRVDQDRAPLPILGSLSEPPGDDAGCAFRARCPYAVVRCATEAPALRKVGPGQRVAGHDTGEGGWSSTHCLSSMFGLYRLNHALCATSSIVARSVLPATPENTISSSPIARYLLSASRTSAGVPLAACRRTTSSVTSASTRAQSSRAYASDTAAWSNVVPARRRFGA